MFENVLMMMMNIGGGLNSGACCCFKGQAVCQPNNQTGESCFVFCKAVYGFIQLTVLQPHLLL